MRLPFVPLLLLGAQLAASAPTPGWQAQLHHLSGVYQALAEHIDPTVVQVIATGYGPVTGDAPSVLRAKRGTGAGVLVDPSGYIVTNAHVLGDVRRVQVLVPQAADPKLRTNSPLKPSGQLLTAEVVGADRETDLAVLKIQGGPYPYLPFADSDAIRQGQLVFAFGSPYGLENSVTMGIVSSVARQVRPDDPMVYIQTDAAIHPGNSGGPLVDSSGAVVGINTFMLSRSGANEGVGFAAPSNLVRSIFEQIRLNGRVLRGQIGIVPQTITPALATALQLPQDWGVLIADVAPGSSAQSAGLQVDDIVLSANGKPLENARQLGLTIYQNAGNTLALSIQRGSRTRTIQVAVLERPKDPDRILSLVKPDRNFVPQLGILAVDLDEKVAPLLPTLRKFAGAVVAGIVVQTSSLEDSLHSGDVIYSINGTPIDSLDALKTASARLKHGDHAALHIERLGQLQYLLLEIE